MKRHYDIMRIMRVKVVGSRELWSSIESVIYVQNAIQYRVDDLASVSASSFLPLSMLTGSTHADTFSQQRLDPEKQFQTFAYGIASHSHSSCTVPHSDALIVQVFPR